MDILIINNRKTILDWDSKLSKQKYISNMEAVAKKINSTSNFKKVFIIVAGSFMFFETVMAATGNPLSQAEVLGKTIFSIAMKIGKYLVLTMAAVDITKSLMQSDTKSVPKIMIHYVFAYAALKSLPWFIDFIDTMFK